MVPIEIPPLRNRREDIFPLIRFFLDKYNRKHRANKLVTDDTLKMLLHYQWPGNIRELANLIERMVVITPRKEILPENLPELTAGNVSLRKEPGQAAETVDSEAGSELSLPLSAEMGLQEIMESIEKNLLQQAYERYGSSYAVAKELRISQSTAIRKAYKYGIRIKPGEV